ncbi:MAG: hypothetical protein KDE09_00175 [Anaerolineales bacterium]|nr:hypothetical protein [Anaerolineales bacterium]MCB0026591.1 hypothetical protein [Anaerolineales bacterium]
MIPYLIVAFLYLLVAILAALETSFISWGTLPWFNGMVWLRIHFITIGVITQIIFGVTPILTAKIYNLPKPKIRWDIWALLNAGIILLVMGIPLISKIPIISGGTLIFIATTLLIMQLAGIKRAAGKNSTASHGRKFYISGFVFFLIGVLVGTGLFTGWSGPLGIIGDAGEVHIHAQNWGFLSLVFAGFFIDLYPVWTKRELSNMKAITPIFWMLIWGAFTLVLSPWFGSQALALIGAPLHVAASIWLLVIAIEPLHGDKAAWTPGISHLLTSYFWLFAPLFTAPWVIFGLESDWVPTAALNSMTPQALIYGWVLQFSFAILPYFYHRFFLGNENAELGGTWLSLILVNLGSIILWASILVEPMRNSLHGIAYMLWAISFLPVTVDIWQKTKMGMEKAETAIL